LNHEPKITKALVLLIGERIYRINRMFVEGRNLGLGVCYQGECDGFILGGVELEFCFVSHQGARAPRLGLCDFWDRIKGTGRAFVEGREPGLWNKLSPAPLSLKAQRGEGWCERVKVGE